MLKRLATVMILAVLTGCYRWAPVTSLSEITDDSVEVRTRDETYTLAHATAVGHVIHGTRDGETVDVDLVEATPLAVRVRRTNGVAIGVAIGAFVIVVGGIALGVAIAIASSVRNIPVENGGF